MSSRPRLVDCTHLRGDTLAFAAAWARANPDGEVVIDGDRHTAAYRIRTYEGDLMQTTIPLED